MKTMWMGIMMMILAAPAMALGKGACCADVNGICISKCQKASCTGKGDCELALTAAPDGVEPSSPAVKRASRTLRRRDRGELNRLFATSLKDGGGSTAIGKGECCAKVNNACISSCQKSSCTGAGDCDLVLTATPKASASSPDVRAAMKTLDRQDQATFRGKLVNPSDPPHVPPGRPDTEPVQGVKEPGGGIRKFSPSLKQTGGTTAQVPMKHGACLDATGQPVLDSSNHVLAVTSGNLNVPALVELTCPAGQTVTHLSYRVEGQSAIEVVKGDSGQVSVSKALKIQPFSASDLEGACQEAFGGCWARPGKHGNSSATAKKTIQETVHVWGRCSAWTGRMLRTFPVALTVTCEDRNF